MLVNVTSFSASKNYECYTLGNEHNVTRISEEFRFTVTYSHRNKTKFDL